MIRHLVVWTIAAEDPAEKARIADEIGERLLGLVGVVPSIRRLEILRDAAGFATNADVAVDADFTDLDGLREYIEHPVHQEVAGWIRSVVSARSAIDAEV